MQPARRPAGAGLRSGVGRGRCEPLESGWGTGVRAEAARAGLRRLAERFEGVHARLAVERATPDLLCLLRAPPKLTPDLGAGALLALGAEAERDHLALVLRQGVQGLRHLLGDDAPVDLLLGRLVVGGAEVAERGGVGVVAELHVEARRRVVDGADLLDLVDLHAGDRRDLVELGLTLELDGELVADAPDLPCLRGHVGREADGARGVVEAALDRLTDPQGGVGREAEALAPVELLRRADEPEHALLDEVVQGQPMALVPAGDGDDGAQVGIDEPVLGKEVAALDALGELDLLPGVQQLELVRPPKELVERVGVDVALMIFKDLGLLLGLGQDPPGKYRFVQSELYPVLVAHATAGRAPGYGAGRRLIRIRGEESQRARGRTAGGLLRVSNIRSLCRAVTHSARMELCCWPILSTSRAPLAGPPRAARKSTSSPARCAASRPTRCPRASRSSRASCASGRSASAGRRCGMRRPAPTDGRT